MSPINQKIKASVIIRSFNRLPALLELLDILTKQDFREFEIIVIDQSGEWPEKFITECLSFLPNISSLQLHRYGATQLMEGQAPGIYIHIYSFEPLGGPGARNKGVELSKSDLAIFIDDDDLPLDTSWVRRHVELHRARPDLIAVSGRQVHKLGEECPYLGVIRPFLRFFVLQYSFLKTPYTFARYDRSVEPVEWVHGTNASIKKNWIIRAGGWDTHIRNQDEHSFAFKLMRLNKGKNRIRFEHSIVALRRTGVPGGMDKRIFSVQRELQNQWTFMSKVIARYFPIRFGLFFPLYGIMLLIRVAQKTISRVQRPSKKASGIPDIGSK